MTAYDTSIQPGHEYTKANVKFGVTVSQNAAIKRLEDFASKNKETQGKFTIGDERVRQPPLLPDIHSTNNSTQQHNVFMRVSVCV